jgi:pyridoxamine 5'-phosphate oxidase family protein
MSHFTPEEITYLQSQLLGRLATVGRDGDPHVVPVGYRYNPELDTIDIGGHGIARSRKYRDVARSGRAAFVVDDLLSTDPWTPRMLEVRGSAEVSPTGGQEIHPSFDPELIRISPMWIGSFGLNAEGFELDSRTIG